MAAPSRILLAGEAGGGRGHTVAFVNVATALGSAARSYAILPRMHHARLLRRLCEQVDHGPAIERLPTPPPARGVSWARWLLETGHADPATLHARFDWWQRALVTLRPALVVADFAPTVQLAARSLRLPVVAIGGAYFLPPPALPRFPQILTRDEALQHGPVSEDGPEVDEDAICAAINSTLGPHGLPPLSRLPEVYLADASAVRGMSLLDPYAGQRDQPLVLPPGDMPPLQDGPGDEVFIYFSTGELKEPAICEALQRMPFPARLVASHLTPDLAARLADNPNLTIADGPLPPPEIVARSRAILCAGQTGTLSLALLAGLPVLGLPVQQEHLFNCLRASARTESCRFVPRAQRTADAILDTLAELLANSQLPGIARHHAQDLRREFPESAIDTYRARIVPLLA